MNNKSITYAEAISELEKIVDAIDTEAIDVDHLAEKVKRAAHLITVCKTKLKQTEDDVKKVLEDIEAEDVSEQGRDKEEGF